MQKIESAPVNVSSGIGVSFPSKDSTGIIHQLQTKVLKQQRQMDRMRRQLSSSGDVLSSDVESGSEFGDDADLLLDATLTSEPLVLPDFALEDDNAGSNPAIDHTNSLATLTAS